MSILPPATRDRAYQVFLQEAPELLQVLEENLLSLGEKPDVKQLNHLMRAAHSIKGCAASIGLETIQSIAHQLEDIFRALYRRETDIDAELEELLLKALDSLQGPLRSILQQPNLTELEGQTNDESWLAAAEPIFAHLHQKLAAELEADQGELPSMSEMGIDLVKVIFSGDVKQGIDYLAERLQQIQLETLQKDAYSSLELQFNDRTSESSPWVILASELRAQAEVFRGVGEITNLPGFCEIAETVIAALNHHPEDSLTITQLAIQNFRAAARLVLRGDRLCGGMPSPALSELAQLSPTDYALMARLQASEQPHPTSNSRSTNPTFPNTEISAPILSNVLRVDRSRFDRLSAHVGDLMTYENMSKRHNEQLNSIVTSIRTRLEQLDHIHHALQVLHGQPGQGDRNANRPLPRSSSAGSSSAGIAQPGILTDLATQIANLSNRSVTQILADPLQFDTYTPEQNLTQSAFEELACLQEIIQDLTLLTEEKTQQQRHKFKSLRATQNDLLWIRMLPIEQILQRFPRMVRDLCSKYEKQVQVKLVGASTLIDKAVLEKLFDPLVHLVRNAFDHGVELPAVRESHQKPPQATIEIKAYHQGNLTYVEIRDDGNGIDLEKIAQKAITLGLTSLEELSQLTEEEILEFIFAPGFSTAIQVSELSGRGVGLDAVRENLRSLKGDVQVFSNPGEGTMFRLTFPLTLTIAELLIFRVQGLLLSLPVNTLAGIVMMEPHELEQLEGRTFYRDGEGLIEVTDLSILQAGLPLLAPLSPQLNSITLPQVKGTPLLIIEQGDDWLGIPVDQIIQRQEQVIKPFTSIIPVPEYLCGCTVLGNGTLVPVLDSRGLIRAHRSGLATPQTAPISPPKTQSKTLLIIDDTLTMRALLTDSLTKLGYQCVTAREGREALQMLEQIPEIDAVFSDLEMPVMNGFEFLQACRQQYSKDQLPVIILTSRNGEKHRQLADNLGANAYLTKPFLEHQLIQVLTQCSIDPCNSNPAPLELAIS